MSVTDREEEEDCLHLSALRASLLIEERKIEREK
jgi:hypothetical protein